MASSTSILLLLLVTISSPLIHQIHARESQFFSKVTNAPIQTETEQQQQPEFVPQNQNGHGLYGQENTQDETKSGVQNQTPATYASERYYSYNNDRNRAETEREQFGNREGETFYVNNGERYYSTKDQNDDPAYVNNGEKYYSTKDQNDDAAYMNNREKYYSSQEQNDDTLLDFDDSEEQNDDALFNNNNSGVGTEHYPTEKDSIGETYYTKTDNDQFGSQLSQTETNYNDDKFTNELNTQYNKYRTGTTTQNRRGSNVERQGMSDTRFLENGRYYYDLNMEKNQYANQNTYKYNPNSEFGSREYQSNEADGVNANYYNHNNNKFYDNSGGEKYEFNTMEEYERSRQNQYNP